MAEKLIDLEQFNGHTDGPWRASDRNRGWVIEREFPCINGLHAWFSLIYVYAPDEADEGMSEGRFNYGAQRANARLAAAAPALLSENRRLREMLEEMAGVMRALTECSPYYLPANVEARALLRRYAAMKGEK